MKKSHQKRNGQWFQIITLFCFLIVLGACEKECVCPPVPPSPTYPSLRVANQSTDGRIITAVRFVGYDFNNLKIEIGDSQTFTLDQGMPGGYENINVVVYFAGEPRGSVNTLVNFKNDVTESITLKGCISFEGCRGFYLE